MKEKLGSGAFLYPMPTVLVGAMVNGKANFMTCSFCGVVQHVPALIAVSLGKKHHTNIGIRETGVFSVNIPDASMAEITDYCGIFSGGKVGKEALFTVFYGGLKSAPMIEECPVNMECKVVDKLDLGHSNEIFVGEVAEAYAAPSCMKEGKPDIAKVNPMIFSMHDNTYWKVGAYIGKAWKMGRNYREQK